MYPNPQDVLPLPPRPSLEHYRKRAKDLVKACKSGEPHAIRTWVGEWLGRAGDDDVDDVAQFARETLTRDRRAHCALNDAQLVIARAHGFLSWPKFAKHLEALARASSAESAFERAAEAIIDGDAGALTRLLRENEGLIRARSTREHRATLLHYVAANGVENYRQRTPKNAAEIATILLDAGAEVDAEADMYGGGAKTLELVATSVHPEVAGVQVELMDLLLQRGARLDEGAVNACLANGRLPAAQYLASRGASLDLEGAAGVGGLDRVRQILNREASAAGTAAEVHRAFSTACAYGQLEDVRLLLERGVDPAVPLRGHGDGHSALHVAAYGGHAEIVKLLLERGVPVDPTDTRWGTTPLIWAMHAWRSEPAAVPERYHDVVARLVTAGAAVPSRLLEEAKVRADPKMLSALTK